jgi:hypothetical protein
MVFNLFRNRFQYKILYRLDVLRKLFISRKVKYFWIKKMKHHKSHYNYTKNILRNALTLSASLIMSV